MTRYVIGFNDSTEVAIERDPDGVLLVHAKAGDRHIDELGLRGFARPIVPGSVEVVLAGMAVEMVRWLSRAHGGIDKAWSEKEAFALLQQFAAAEKPMPDSAPPDPPDIAEVLRKPREAASPAAPFRGADAPVPGWAPVHDGTGLRALEADPVMACLEEARARFTEEVVRPVEPPSDPFYARHWTPARGWRAKVSSLRLLSEVLDAALEPEHAGHPRLGDVQALKARIAELSVTWRTKAMNAEGKSGRAA
ncbi:MAG: hypothetical protein INR70_17845 [Parafilimonas terrae]|nr:hypothetical protein [Parafilimonas terrae]